MVLKLSKNCRCKKLLLPQIIISNTTGGYEIAGNFFDLIIQVFVSTTIYHE
jgi:hypothetical protein